MKTFEVYDNGIEKVAVKKGVSWPGLFLDIIWALWKKLWLLSSLFIMSEFLMIIIGAASELTDDETMALCRFTALCWKIYLFFRGNYHLRNKLVKHGYRLINIVVAPNSETAVSQTIFSRQTILGI